MSEVFNTMYCSSVCVAAGYRLHPWATWALRCHGKCSLNHSGEHLSDAAIVDQVAFLQQCSMQFTQAQVSCDCMQPEMRLHSLCRMQSSATCSTHVQAKALTGTRAALGAGSSPCPHLLPVQAALPMMLTCPRLQSGTPSEPHEFALSLPAMPWHAVSIAVALLLVASMLSGFLFQASVCRSRFQHPGVVSSWFYGQWALGSDGLLCFAWFAFGVQSQHGSWVKEKGGGCLGGRKIFSTRK